VPAPAIPLARRLTPRHLGAPVVMVVVMALPILSAPAQASTPAKASKTVAKVAISKLAVNDTKVAITGRVTLPAALTSTAKRRKKVTVAFTLAGTTGKREAFAAKVTVKRTFTVTHTTKLTGALGLTAQVKVDGKVTGKKLAKAVKVTPRATTPTGALPANGTTGTSPTGTSPTDTSPGGGNGPGATTNPPPPGANKLNGLFRLAPGTQSISGTITGSHFVMKYQSAALQNGDSPFYDKAFTPLRPGSDGGLSTVKYQPAPTPAFAGGDIGGSLASSITQPQKFFGYDFSITTDPVDRQTGQPTPLAEIYEKDGKLFGQTSAWDAQWNGLSFNQGSPKPDGTYQANPGTTPSWAAGGTVAVFGTYDSATKHFTLKWQSLIVGGPFNTYTGQWNLEGTFEAAA
jgi:hypothetical protein